VRRKKDTRFWLTTAGHGECPEASLEVVKKRIQIFGPWAILSRSLDEWIYARNLGQHAGDPWILELHEGDAHFVADAPRGDWRLCRLRPR